MNKRKFIDTFHSFTLIFYSLSLCFLAMFYTHPLYLGALFLLIAIAIYSIQAQEKWKKYLIFSLMMTLFIVVINMLVSKRGSTVVFRGSITPVFGRLVVTKEAICFGLTMALKLAVITSIFCFYDSAMNADKAFSFFSKLTPKSALVVIMTSLMIPQMKRRLDDISTVMKFRGADFDNRHLLSRIKSRYPLLKILLLSSLEGSWQTAEALYARAFDSGKRTYYSKESWQIRDSVIAYGVVFSLVGFACSVYFKNGTFTFYPVMKEFLSSRDLIFVSWILCGFLSLPLLNLGWNKWNFLRSKI